MTRQHAVQRRESSEEEHEGGQKMAPPTFQLFANPAEPPADSPSTPPVSNKTGMPDQLKSGVEQLSGMDMSDVNVHYNSDKPAQLQAHAYAQGSDIHVAPGQEQHLAHEAWHVAQQKQGRVTPTIQAKGVDINDDSSLEKEADDMGAKAMQLKPDASGPKKQVSTGSKTAQKVAQRQLKVDVDRSRNSDEEDVAVADLGYADGSPLLEFASLMKEDASAIVKPSTAATPSQKGSKMKAKLNSIPLTASALKADFINRLMQGNDWLDAGATMLGKIKAAVQAQLDDDQDMASMEYDVENTATDWAEVIAAPSSFSVDLKAAVTTAIGTALNGVTDVGKMGTLAFSEEWSRALASSAYDLTRATFYAETVSPGVKQPFLQLISDINDDKVTELEFVEKYNSAAGLGAEFKVSAPNDLATKYDGVAVVHTHYAANTDQPNYGHTKPYERRKKKGYGYTKVDLDTLNGMDDTQKTYNAL